MYDRLKQFLNKQSIFYNYQYGFRERCSTQRAILHIVNRIQRNMDKGMFSWGATIKIIESLLQIFLKTGFLSWYRYVYKWNEKNLNFSFVNKKDLNFSCFYLSSRFLSLL